MSQRYIERLSGLLRLSVDLSSTLRPRPSEEVAVDKGVLGEVAHAVQGLTPTEAASIISTKPDWTAEWTAGRVGEIVDYGVSEKVVRADVFAWVAEKVKPQSLQLPIFEADVAGLGVELADRLVKSRTRMRGIRSRCELCVRIAAAVEGKGRKVAPAALEKLKLQLEKAEAAEIKKDERRRAAEERAAAAERAKLLREKKREEKEEKKSAKESSVKKKKLEMNKTKSFMMRFVKKVQSPSVVRSLNRNLDAAASPGKRDNTAGDIDIVAQGSRMVGMAAFKDKGVLSVSLWLVLQIKFDYTACSVDVLRGQDDFICSAKKVQEHLVHCGERRKEAERNLGRILGQYRRERAINREDRMPRFAARRSGLRGRGKSGPIQLLQFHENYRPAFVGTTSRRSGSVSGRRPFAKDVDINYEYDSEDEWEEEAEDGESLSDVEVEKERAHEDAELRMLYGSDDESDDEDFLDDENAEDDGEGDDDDEASDDQSTSPSRKDVVMVDNDSANRNPAVVDVDAWQAPEVIDVETFQPSKKRPAPTSKSGVMSKKKRRRKQALMNRAQVQIIGIDFGDSGKPSMLDKFAVQAHIGAPLFEIYDPVKEEDRLKQALAARPVQVVRLVNSRSVLDAPAKFSLAMLIFGQSAGKDRLVHQFLLLRKSKQQEVPTMSEVYRAIVELAVREKRGTDTRAHFYLRDPALDAAVRDQLARTGRPQIDFGPIAAPVVAATASAGVHAREVGVSGPGIGKPLPVSASVLPRPANSVGNAPAAHRSPFAAVPAAELRKMPTAVHAHSGNMARFVPSGVSVSTKGASTVPSGHDGRSSVEEARMSQTVTAKRLTG